MYSFFADKLNYKYIKKVSSLKSLVEGMKL